MGKDIRISSISKEYVKVPVRGFESGSVVDPTGFTTRLAFTTENVEPLESDWITGEWETWPTSSEEFYLARALVGPGSSLELTDGQYDIWVNIQTPTEDIRKRADGRLIVT